ncbi:hypothetical protein N7488_008814 [Penicillium malachiteum]|nr:hypothetical protein N7488_008814 [Penicillium malachiteum]
MSAENNNAATNVDAGMGDDDAHGGDGPDGTADQVHDTNDVWMPTVGTRQAPQSEQISPQENFDTPPASILPPIRSGLRDEPPGAWANWICKIPYPVVRSDKSILFEEIKWLSTLNNRRELVVKRSRLELESESGPMTGNTLNLQIGSKRIRVQSALVQVKRLNMTCLCEQCRKGLGPWPGCKVVQHPMKLISACSNCLWRGKAKKCMYYRPPLGEKDHERDSIWVSQSTIDELKNQFDDLRRCLQAERRIVKAFTRRGLLVPPFLRARLPSSKQAWRESFKIFDELLHKPLRPNDDEDVADADGDEDEDDVEPTDADNDDGLSA